MNPALSNLLLRILASGPGSAAAAVVAGFPGIWKRWVLERVMPPLHPAGVDTLRQLVAEGGDPALLLYSMAMEHLANPGTLSDARALACLRTAEFLGYEGKERLDLHLGLLAARRGDLAGAVARRKRIASFDLSEEQVARLDASIANPGEALAGYDDPREGTVVLLGETAVASSHWFNAGRIVWVCPQGNGLTLAWLAARHVDFDFAIGDQAELELARTAGIRFGSSIVPGLAAKGQAASGSRER